MDKLKDEILACILKKDWVSFAELQRIPEFTAERQNGGMELVHGEFDNMILWSGISQQGVKAIQELGAEGKIHWEAEPNALSYIVDGAVPSLPIARRARSYAKPHWLPVLYRPGPIPENWLKAADRRTIRRENDAQEQT